MYATMYSTFTTIKSSSFAVSFRGIIRMGSAFIVLEWFTLTPIGVQVTILHIGEMFWINRQMLIQNWLHITLRIASPTTCNQCLQMKCWRANVRTEKANTLDTKPEDKLRQIE